MSSTITRKKDVGHTGNGGEFARTKFAEADDAVGFDEPQPRPMTEYLQDPRIVALTHEIAREEFSRTCNKHPDWYPGYSPDDLAQGIMERLIRQSDRIDAGTTTARHTDNPGRLIRRSIQNWQVDLYRQSYGRASVDDQAVRMLDARIDEYHEANGHQPSQRVVDEWATEIRSQWDGKKNRPKENFHRLSVKHVQEEEGTIQDWRMTVTGHVTETEGAVFEREVDESDYGKRRSHIQDILDDGLTRPDGKPVPKAQRQQVIANAKKHVWSMYSSRTGAPGPAPDSIEPESAEQMCETLGIGTNSDGEKRRGCVLVAADEWEAGESTQRTQALFAPFGPDISRAEEQRIVDTVRENESYAEGVYESALLGATKSRSR